MRLFVMFLALPIIEIALFIQVGGLIGLLPTLALVIGSAALGIAVMRAQGAKAGLEVQRSLSQMRDPSRPLAHGALIIVAGLLLVVPGFFTDAVGLLLLIPGVRTLLMRRLAHRVTVSRAYAGSASMGHDPHRPPYDKGVIDGEFEVAPDAGASRTAPLDLPLDPDDTPLPGRNSGRGSGWTRH